MASAHLRYLYPESNCYADAEAYHLAQTLSGFQSDLSNIHSSYGNADTIIACSFILLHHAWSAVNSTDIKQPSIDSSNISKDNILAFASGLKNVLLSVWHVREGSVFKDIIDASQLHRFKQWAVSESAPSGIEKLLMPNPDVSWLEEDESSINCTGMSCGSIDAVARLVPVMRAVDYRVRKENIEHILPEIAPYLLMWPGKSTDAFQQEVRENDSEALLIMLCYYICSQFLLSEDFWWTHKRSKYMCRVISSMLTADGNPCADRVEFLMGYLETSRAEQKEG